MPALPVPRRAARRVVGAFLLLAPALVVSAEGQSLSSGYRRHAALSEELNRLRSEFPTILTVEEIALSPGGRAIHAVTVAAPGPVTATAAADRPALMVVANAWGQHLVGSSVALGVLRRLASGYGSDSAVTALLDRVTVYVVPRANPDAAEAFFARPQWERSGNETPTDDDRDGMVDEDGPEDLNGDGVITMMRVQDSLGGWLPDSAEPRLMRQAKASEGERGAYRLLVEGVDNDGDEEWNEDGPGGVDVNKNFSYEYRYFSVGSGADPMAASETRAIAQFVVDHPNVAAFYVLGPQDNLLEAWKKQEGPGGTSQTGPLEGVLSEDEPWLSAVAKRFRESTGLKKGPAVEKSGGDALSWGYFHAGRWSFGSRVWWPPETTADSVADSARAGAPPRDKGKGSQDDPLADDRRALRWIDAHTPEGFVDWTAVSHPDFPGRTVEVGGFRPFVRIAPPGAMLDSVIAKQADFVLDLAGLLPRIELHDVEVERIGERVYRVTARVANTGFLPTSSRLGQRVRWPRPVRVDLETEEGQELAAGRAVQLLEPLEGSGGSVELAWVVVGTAGSSVVVRAGSAVAGTASHTVTLR